MQVDAMNVVWRTRSTWEGGDLGVRLLQSSLGPTFRCYLTVAVPLFALFAATVQIASWLPVLLIWLSKPWLDRTILFALSRSLFGTTTTSLDVWRSQRTVWWSRLLHTLTLRRLSASRAFTQPIIQLEGLTGAALRARINQVATRHRSAARFMTQAFAAAEFALCASLYGLQFWLAPHHTTSDWSELRALAGPAQSGLAILYYAIAVSFLEPFYVAAGFGMYLNRRVELEAWDIEQEFRRAFAA
jgi:hypothetical protein